MGGHNLLLFGFSHSRTERSVSTGGKSLASSVRGTGSTPVAVVQRQSGGRASFPGRRTNDVISGCHTPSPSSSTCLFCLLGFFPASGISQFHSFSVDTSSNSMAMDCTDPVGMETLNRACSVLLPQGAIAYCGTTTGSLIRWNIRCRLPWQRSCSCSQVRSVEDIFVRCKMVEKYYFVRTFTCLIFHTLYMHFHNLSHRLT